MSTIHFNQTTTLTPEQYVAGLTDFGPGRSKTFGNSFHKVDRGVHFAAWERPELFSAELRAAFRSLRTQE